MNQRESIFRATYSFKWLAESMLNKPVRAATELLRSAQKDFRPTSNE